MAQNNSDIMGIDLLGRVNKIKLAGKNMLLPLFEAIVNSIHAIEDAKIPNGDIRIIIHRDASIGDSNNGFGIPCVKQFDIIDNGVGFNDENYKSFKDVYSTYKAERGAKGLGRLTWLKTFNDINIESVFYKDKVAYQRNFRFNLMHNAGISAVSFGALDDKVKRETMVQLLNYKDLYKYKCPKKAETIATRIVEHCFIYFQDRNCPSISLIDGSDSINLNARFEELTEGNSCKESFSINDYEFAITLYKWYEHDELTYHKMALCANNREVEDFNLSEIFHDIHGKIYNEETNRYYLITGYIESEYLDNNVNDERTKVDFASGKLYEEDLISRKELYDALVPIIKKHFEEEVRLFQQKKIEKIQTFIDTTAPQYKILLSKEGILDDISISDNASEQEIDLKLYKAYQNIDFESRRDVIQIIKKMEDNDNSMLMTEEYHQVLQSISEVNKSKLAQYIVHRKYILNLFEQSIALNESGKYELEKTVHDIVFPTKKSSDEILFEEQNLWLIDERLSFHTFLTSEKPLNSIDGLETESSDRPDVVIFNNPITFAEGVEAPLNSIVLIEFKRPMRNGYNNSDDNPIFQLYDYVEQIREGKKLMRNGRRYPITKDTIFYAYLVCDINDKVRKLAEYAKLNITSDGFGYYGYNDSLKCVIEILTFDQILTNANKRNKILFHKLGI